MSKGSIVSIRWCFVCARVVFAFVCAVCPFLCSVAVLFPFGTFFLAAKGKETPNSTPTVYRPNPPTTRKKENNKQQHTHTHQRTHTHSHTLIRSVPFAPYTNPLSLCPLPPSVSWSVPQCASISLSIGASIGTSKQTQYVESTTQHKYTTTHTLIHIQLAHPPQSIPSLLFWLPLLASVPLCV